MDIRATQKYIVESPKKLREVAAMLRTSKLSPVDSLERLELMSKKAAQTLRKVVNVAIANAKQVSLNPDELIFKEIQINEGPVLKRFRAGSRGRAKPYKKRMTHIRIVLTTKVTKTEEPKGSLKDEKTDKKVSVDKVKMDKKMKGGKNKELKK
jgi:large subunit ribosomal protein L22